VDGGDSMKCYAKDWNNFVRVDDEGNEIIPKIIDKIEQEERKEKPTKSEIINMIDEMRAKIESLPPHVMTTPINHYDYYSLLVLMSAALRSD
jgi:thymidylate synthase